MVLVVIKFRAAYPSNKNIAYWEFQVNGKADKTWAGGLQHAMPEYCDSIISFSMKIVATQKEQFQEHFWMKID